MAGNHVRWREFRECQSHGLRSCCARGGALQPGGARDRRGRGARHRNVRHKSRSHLSRPERCGKRPRRRPPSTTHGLRIPSLNGSCLDPEAAHDVAEVLPGCARLDLLPPGRRIHVELGQGAHEDRVLHDARVLQQIGREADAALLVESERLGLGKEPRREVLARAVAQGHLSDLRMKLLDLCRGQNGDVSVRVRCRQEHIPVEVRRTPSRRDCDATLFVEGVPKKAREKCFAGMSHWVSGGRTRPTTPHFNPFYPTWVKLRLLNKV